MNEQNKYCPETNLVWAILCTVLCCLPLGIVAIIKATSVERLWREGREYEAADDAKKYSIWGAVVFAVIMILYFALLFIGVFAAAAGY